MKRKPLFTLFSLLVILLWTTQLSAQNLIQNWSGNGVTGDASKPNNVGWLNTVSASIPWNTANGSGGCRFRDAGVGFTAGTFTNEDGSANNSRQLMLRYDNSAYSSSVYAFPVTLAANTTYDFSIDFLCGGNATPPQDMTIGASTTASAAGQIVTKTITTTKSATVYRNATLTFASTSAGTYYITIAAAWGWYGVTNLNLVKSSVQLNELNNQYNNLVLENPNEVVSDLNLPTELGSKGVKVSWTSSNENIVSISGHVTRPEKYNAPVRLEAKLSQLIGDSTYTMTKNFTVIVLGIIGTPLELAQWNFDSRFISVQNGTVTVKDTISNFVGTLMNDARIRTIGAAGPDQFNVLDLGNGKGYFDLGTEIGEAIYSLTDYSIAGYFRIDDSYTGLADSQGNFYWTFSNSADIDADKNGYMIGSLKTMTQSVSTSYYNSGNQATGKNENAPKGKWHHIAYVQNGNTGTVYLDGVQVAQNESMTNLPAFALPRTGLTGTPYNWLGRSNYKNDAYLRNTLLYDFRLMSVPLSDVDISLDYLNVLTTLDQLNNAYASDPDYRGPELVNEMNALDLGNLSAVKENLVLPAKGNLDPSISILWKSSNPNLIDATGVVTRPDFYNYTDTLTATLIKNGQSLNKKFYATVVAKDGSAFVNDLLVKYDFTQVSSDSIVTDVAEKHFTGKIKNEATIGTIGTSTTYKVLSLGDSIGYFDMGVDVGKLMYNLTDYTLSAYYRIDNSYSDDELKKNGNFLWNFSNSNDIINKAATGYLIGSLRNQAVTITPTNWTPEQTVTQVPDVLPSKGSWHNMTYTQSGTTGTLYVDGLPVATKEVTLLPKNTLAKEGLLGTIYNWIGRSCYTGDVYLRNSLVHDFRIYRVALSESQIQTSELNVANKIAALNNAYSESGGVNSIRPEFGQSAYYSVDGETGYISISGLNGTEKVSVHDLSGRLVNGSNRSIIAVRAGIYIVKVDNYVSKVVVK